MKRFLSVLLLCALILSVPVSVYAEDQKEKSGVNAVAIVREGPGLPLVADTYSLRKTRNADGSSCEEELGTVPSENVSYFTADQLELMPENSRKEFEKQLSLVQQMDPEIVKYLFWIELTGDFAGKAGEQPDGSRVELDMWFSDYENQELYALENGHDAELDDSIKNGNYRLTLKETGAVVISAVGIRMVEGVMEIITEEKKEGKLVWVDSPVGGWAEDVTSPAVTVRTSKFVPTFTQEEYEIKLIVARMTEEDELITHVPTDDMFVVTLNQMDVLTPDAQDDFVREYERIRDDTEHIVEYFFYIDLSEQYRALVGEQEDGSVQYLLLSFIGDRDDYIVTSNGHPMEVVQDENEEGTYLIKLTELGALAICYPDDVERAE